jgi:uncharacterized membrane protein HdeD (DUF308 family)
MSFELRRTLVDDAVKNWGWVAVRGVAALLFGVLTFFEPGISLALLVLFFGAYALVDGIFAIILAVSNRRAEPHWGALLLAGVLGIVAGIVTFMWPGLTAFVLLYIIAARAIIVGILEIVVAVRLRKLITGEWLLILAGVLSIAFGVLVAMFPGAGALTVVLWIGAYAIVVGVLQIVLALRLRSWGQHHPPLGAPRTV